MKQAEQQPETISVTVYAGIFCKLYRVPASGTLIPQHAHAFDHMTMLLQGAMHVWCNDEVGRDVTAPANIRIAANAIHKFLTLVPDTVFACIHNVDHYEADEPPVSTHVMLELED